MDKLINYYVESLDRIKSYKNKKDLLNARDRFFEQVGIGKGDCIYNYHWQGTPILQLPTDLITFQDMLYRSKTNKIIETGIAFGGSVLFNASILHLMEFQGLINNPQILAIDIEIRPHNLEVLNQSPFKKYYTLLEASSLSNEANDLVSQNITDEDSVMIFLDSNHTHDHVLEEMLLYAGFCSIGNYIVVGDTAIENAPEYMVSKRPWKKGNSPLSALNKFLSMAKDGSIKDKFTGNPCDFEIDLFPINKNIFNHYKIKSSKKMLDGLQTFLPHFFT